MALCHCLYVTFILGLLAVTSQGAEQVVTCASTPLYPKVCELPGKIIIVTPVSTTGCYAGLFTFAGRALTTRQGCAGTFRVVYEEAISGEVIEITCVSTVQFPKVCELPGKILKVEPLRTTYCVGLFSFTGRELLTRQGCGGAFRVTYEKPAISTEETVISCVSTPQYPKVCELPGKIISVTPVSVTDCYSGLFSFSGRELLTRQGCGGTFRVVYEKNVPPREQIVRCESTLQNQRACQLPDKIISATLVQRLSTAECFVGGDTNRPKFYVSLQYLIVWGGCGGDFRVILGETYMCVSTQGNVQSCELPNKITSATVAKPLTAVDCREGITFSFSQQFLFVWGGCGAEFTVIFESGGPTPPTRKNCIKGKVSTTCYSDGTFEMCPVPMEVSSITLVTSDNPRNPCEAGYYKYYGIDQNRIFVKNGCGGKFEVQYKFCPTPSNCGNFKQKIECPGRNSLHRNTCRLDVTISDLVILQEYSTSGTCIRGQTYFDNIDAVVVRNKCQALFSFDAEVCDEIV